MRLEETFADQRQSLFSKSVNTILEPIIQIFSEAFCSPRATFAEISNNLSTKQGKY